jgi:hypothetical protein
MFQIEVDGMFAQPTEEVFDFLADYRNETSWNPDALTIEKTSPGPIGVGTRFSSRIKRIGRIDSEVVSFERPNSFSVSDTARGMTGVFDFRFTPSDAGTSMSLRVQMRPHGPLRLLQPLISSMMKRDFARLPARMQTGLDTSKPSTA